jgi:hypothetical protein
MGHGVASPGTGVHSHGEPRDWEDDLDHRPPLAVASRHGLEARAQPKRKSCRSAGPDSPPGARSHNSATKPRARSASRKRGAVHSRSPRGEALLDWIDGMGLKLLRALQAAGHLSGLQEIEKRGCGIRLDRLPGEPPAVWVSAATGFPPAHHGIGGAESAVFPGIKTPWAPRAGPRPLIHAARVLNPWLPHVGEVPVSGLYRKDKMVWEILGEKGVPSFVVNWWATWPALEGPGVRISERAFLRLQVGGPPDREAFPPEEMETLGAVLVRKKGRTTRLPSRPGRAPRLAWRWTPSIWPSPRRPGARSDGRS